LALEETSTYLRTFDGAENQTMSTSSEPGSHNTGSIGPKGDSSPLVGWMLYEPLLWNFRPLSHWDVDKLVDAGATAVVNGRQCLIFESIDPEFAQRRLRYWVDPQRAYCIVREQWPMEDG